MAFDLKNLPGWAEFERSLSEAGVAPARTLTPLLAATVLALQAHAVAQEHAIDLMAGMLADALAKKTAVNDTPLPKKEATPV